MERINGYYDLDKYFNNAKLLNMQSAGLVKAAKTGTAALFWFNYLGQEVLFKSYNNEYACYSEMISEQLAIYLGLPSAHYDLAIFNGKKGVISYNFINPKYKYITFYKILIDFIDNRDTPEGKTYKDLENYDFGATRLDPSDVRTNLEDIWNALEYYLSNKLHFTKEIIPELVHKIMTKITDYFDFQLISGNYDFHSSNLVLCYSENEDFCDLAPLFDNEDMFKLANDILYGSLDTPRLAVERANFANNQNALEVLRRYFAISDEMFFERFKKMMNELDYNTIYYLFTVIEENTEAPMPEKVKVSIAKAFNDNLFKIRELIQEFDTKRTK